MDDVIAARRRIADEIYLSPCPESVPLSELADTTIYCKLEYLQRTGSFKERGARNALLLLDDERRRRGVVAASAGNHALGVAYHGKLLGIPVTVVMPKFAPLIKVTTCRRLGARIELFGRTLADARTRALELAREQGLHYVHGFDDPAVIAGQGTIGLEILEQVPDVEAVVLSVGGGGLAAGVGLAIKSTRPDVLLFGVEPERAASFVASRQARQPVEVAVGPTLADGLAVPRVGDLAFRLADQYVDRVVTVSEEELSLAVLRLAELEKSVVEGAGAAPLAACMVGLLPEIKGRRTVIVLSGGNIDPTILCRVIERGLIVDGRIFRFTAVVPDFPGSLATLAQLIASTGASVKEIAHDRAFAGPDIASVNILCTVETTDREHMRRLLALLKESNVTVLPSQPGEITAMA